LIIYEDLLAEGLLWGRFLVGLDLLWMTSMSSLINHGEASIKSDTHNKYYISVKSDFGLENASF
jgi:hypothetical protein